ncbi:MAG: hypothetical protein HZC24_16955, partial [Rhodocyclales bacterium]|nr:hypothetical protein [Rhodocyclales bacterium]
MRRYTAAIAATIPQTMERLLSHIDAISRQRNRSQLEARLVAALHELCGAQRVGLYKLFAPPGELQVGLAAEHTGKGLRLLDDGISWPAGTGPLERIAHLQACLNDGSRYADIDAASGLRRNSFAIRGSALKVFGFVTLLTALPLDAAKTGMVDGLLAIFRN